MCGFVGYINLDGAPLCPDVLLGMTEAQVHRGPDSQAFCGLTFRDNVTLKSVTAGELKAGPLFEGGVGFNRLSIVDLSDKGSQPMVSVCGKYMLAYNGEIYNAFRLRDDLALLGYKFRSNTDSEVLLALLMEYGIDRTLELIDGMFAFVWVDLSKRTISLARDRLGIKPLYIFESEGMVAFSSEIKSFKRHPKFVGELDNDSIDEYLIFRFCAGERTLLKGVKEILPGTYTSIGVDGAKSKQYFDVSKEGNKDLFDSKDQAMIELERCLAAAVKDQLMGDVRMGCQLSGGIDSSMTTLFARQHFSASMDAFSIIFADERYNEEHWINQVTDATRADSHRYFFDAERASREIETASWHLDQPISVANALGIKQLAARASESVKVMLSGEGADELFCGYSRYHDLALATKLPPKRFGALPYLGPKLESRYAAHGSPIESFIASASVISEQAHERHKIKKSYRTVLDERLALLPSKGDPISAASIYDIKTYMVDLLNRQDKMTMAHSIENRVPFLDIRVVRLALSLPSHLKINAGFNNLIRPSKSTKYLLKELCSSKYDSKFAYRRKSGFALPMADLVFSSSFSDRVEDRYLPSIRARGLFDYRVIENAWRDGRRSHSNTDAKYLWPFLAFEAWAASFLDGD